MGELAISMGMGMGVGDLLFFKKDLTIDHAINLISCLDDKIYVVRDKYV